MLAGEVNTALRGDNVVVQECLLAWIEQRECPSRELVVVPHLGRPNLELLTNLRVDFGQVFQRLANPVARVERPPSLRVFRPRIACEQHTTSGLTAVIGVIYDADR